MTTPTVKRKAVLVAVSLGRSGSSAVMGLLQIAGVHVGQPENLVRPSPMNPKGFFELFSHEAFLRSVYRGFYPETGAPPSIEFLEKVAHKHLCDFAELLQSEFGEATPIGLKSNRHLTIPFFHRLKSELEVKVLVLERNQEEQVSSMLRVRSTSKDLAKRNATRDQVTRYVEEWKTFSARVRAHYPMDYLTVSFNELMGTPIPSTQRIMDFLQLPAPSDEVIGNWFDKSLVNRAAY